MSQCPSSDIPAGEVNSRIKSTAVESTAVEDAPGTTDVGDPKRAGRFSGNTLVGLGFAAVGACALWTGRELAFIDGNHPGPGLVPLGVSVLLIAGGVLMLVRQLLAPVPGPAAPSKTTAVRVIGVIAILAVTVVLFERVGFIISVAFMLAAILFGIERKLTVVSAVVVVATPLICWGLFAELLGVRLPPGLLHF
jgi:putative tricarboxylic transport membrane protein